MKHYWLRAGFLSLALVAAGAQVSAADPAPAERAAAGTAAKPTGPDVVTLNFVNADIEGVVKRSPERISCSIRA